MWKYVAVPGIVRTDVGVDSIKRNCLGFLKTLQPLGISNWITGFAASGKKQQPEQDRTSVKANLMFTYIHAM